MRFRKPYLIYLIVLLYISLLPGCVTLKTIEVEEFKNRESIHLVALEDGTYCQIHSNRQVKSDVENDYLVFQQYSGNTLAKLPLAEVDYCEVYRLSAKKTVCSFLLALSLVMITLFW